MPRDFHLTDSYTASCTRKTLRLLACLPLLLTLLAPIARAEDAETIEKRLAETVRYLASDELEGRGIDTAGLNLAADYIAEQFQAIGLKTDLYDGSPFQKFSVTTSAEMGPAERNHLAFAGAPLAHKNSDESGNSSNDTIGNIWMPLKLGKDFRPLAAGGSTKFDDLPLVFAGYGITAPESNYDDYAGLDVEGKAVIVLRHQPNRGNPHGPLGAGTSRHASFRSKISNAFEHGAAALIFCTGQVEINKQMEQQELRWEAAMDALAEANADFKAIPSPTDEQSAAHRKRIDELTADVQHFSQQVEKQRDTLIDFHRAGSGDAHRTMPIFHATRATIDKMLKLSLNKTLESLEDKIDKDRKPHSLALPGWTISGETNIQRKSVEIKNVLGVLEGSGPHADETIVIGAHYDHLGRGEMGAFEPGNGKIHNGADDNASGIAVLIEIAGRMVRDNEATGKKLARRVVFMAFTGEERGLLGSAQYMRKPLYPIDKTVAMLNLDMVGRLRDNKLIVNGSGTAKTFEMLVDRYNAQHGFKITKSPGGFGPSDHASFYAQKIPAMHFFTGAHKDYHRATDDTDKVNVRGMRRIGLYVADIALYIAAQGDRPEYVAIKRPESHRGGSRPYFGSIPDFAGDKKGYALSGTTPGSPAARAGLQGGDTIIRLGKSKIGNLEDFDSALRKYKSGDKVPVTVLRKGEKVTVEVTLDPPR